MEQTADVLETPQRLRLGPQRRRVSIDPDRSAFLDYWELAKPEISFLVTISALAGFLLGSPDTIGGGLLGLTLAGTALCAAGGGVLNHFIERKYDALMRRTANRPLPSGRIVPQAALLYGLSLLALGFAALWLTNLLTLGLAVLTVVLYLAAYTPLKRHTHYNTLVGTIPGALPALGGYTAATGTFGAAGWVLFAILALWQIPHFLALAWMYRKDYARANYAMLTVVHPDGNSTARQTLYSTIALAAASTLPTAIGSTGWLYLVGAMLLGVWFLAPAYAFFRSRSTRDARRVLMASILYIPVLVVFICVDRWVQ